MMVVGFISFIIFFREFILGCFWVNIFFLWFRWVFFCRERINIIIFDDFFGLVGFMRIRVKR